MKKTIWKYPIPMKDLVELQVPKGAVVLSAQVQGDQPCVWILVDPEAPKEPLRLRVLGTGHEITHTETDLVEFIDTIQLHGGALVFHIFVVVS